MVKAYVIDARMQDGSPYKSKKRCNDCEVLLAVLLYNQAEGGIGNGSVAIQMVDMEKFKRAHINGKIEAINLKVFKDDSRNLPNLERLTEGKRKPYVIIAELRSGYDVSNTRRVGFKIADSNGRVKNIKYRDAVTICNTYKKMGEVPFHNAMFDSEANAIRLGYDCNIPVEMFIVNRVENVAKLQDEGPKKVSNKLLERFSKEQLHELKKGKEAGVDIRAYANPELTAEQMKEVRKGLESGVNARLYAHPDYKPSVMAVYRADMKSGIDIEAYINPEYSVAQLMELGQGVISGIDISKYADVKIPAHEMAEQRMRMEKGMYSSVLVRLEDII